LISSLWQQTAVFLHVPDTDRISQIQTKSPRYRPNLPDTDRISQIQTESPRYRPNLPDTDRISQIQTEPPRYRLNLSETDWISQKQTECPGLLYGSVNLLNWIRKLHRVHFFTLKLIFWLQFLWLNEQSSVFQLNSIELYQTQSMDWVQQLNQIEYWTIKRNQTFDF